MDEQLTSLIKLRNLQNEVITLRTEIPPIHYHFLEKVRIKELKNLLQIPVTIETQNFSVCNQNLVKVDVTTLRSKPDPDKILDISTQLKDIRDVINNIL